VEVNTEEADVRGGEPVYNGEKIIGVTISGAYGYFEISQGNYGTRTFF
jgi:glycine cleavage system aminomethyltransferase T